MKQFEYRAAILPKTNRVEQKNMKLTTPESYIQLFQQTTALGAHQV